MIEMYQLEQLVAIYKSGTISKAAKDMHISQPGLTRSIQRLEKELGFDLFEHKKNKVTLNDNGLLAVKYAQKILNERDHMLIQLKKRIESQQTISIGSCTPAPIWALEFIFKKRYPEMKIKKEITSQKDELLEKLSHDYFSIVVIDHPVQDNRYLCFKLFEEHLYLSLPSLHPLANLKDISFQELDGQSVLLLSSIGLWNEICIKMMPHSHLLLQKNQDTFNELTKLSEIPHFKSNITILKDKDKEKRIIIPITDSCAHIKYYAIIKKENENLVSNLQKEIENIDWKNIE